VQYGKQQKSGEVLGHFVEILCIVLKGRAAMPAARFWIEQQCGSTLLQRTLQGFYFLKVVEIR
jgi:hypothetical protein